MIEIYPWAWVIVAWVYGMNARRMQGSHGTRFMGYMLYTLLVAPMTLLWDPWPVGVVLAALTVLQFIWPGRDFAKGYSLALAHAASMIVFAILIAGFGHSNYWWVPLLVIPWAPMCYWVSGQAPVRERLLGAGGVGIPWVAVVLSL